MTATAEAPKVNLPELDIDPEFRDALGPLTPEELGALEHQILTEDREWIIDVWVCGEGRDKKRVIVDGHNTYDLCRKHGIEYTVTEHNFDDRKQALLFMYERQAGRRNARGRRLEYMRGKLYSNKKVANGKRPIEGQCTVAAFAEAHGVTERTIRNNAEFAGAVDRLPKDLRNSYLGGVFKASVSQLDELTRKLVNNEKRGEIISGLAAGELDIEQVIGRAVSKKDKAVKALGAGIKKAFRAADDAMKLTRNEEEREKLQKAYDTLERLVKLLDLAPEPAEDAEAE